MAEWTTRTSEEQSLRSAEDDLLSCPICISVYTKPKALPCLHTFCENCLREYVFGRLYDTVGHFPCPVCRKEAVIPAGGVALFPDNYHISTVLELCNRTLRSSRWKASTIDAAGGSIENCNGSSANAENSKIGALSSGGSDGVRSAGNNGGDAAVSLAGQNVTFRTESNESGASVAARSRASPAAAAVRAVPDPVVHKVVVEDNISTPIPFVVSRSGTRTFGKYGSDVSELKSPVGLSLSLGNLIVVSDQGENRLLVFSLNGQLLRVIRCHVNVNDIQVTDSDTILVAHSKSTHPLIVEFSMSGECIRSYGLLNRFDATDGVAVLRDPFHVAAVSGETSTLYILNADGKMVHKTTSKSRVGVCRFLAVNSRNQILASDQLTHSVRVFDRRAALMKQFGNRSRGKLYEPAGLCVDCRDDVIVADSGNFCVKRFTSAGKFDRCLVDFTDMQLLRGSVKPINVALSRSTGRLVVLLKGSSLAEVYVCAYTAADKSCLCNASPSCAATNSCACH